MALTETGSGSTPPMNLTTACDDDIPKEPPPAPTRLERIKHFTHKIKHSGKELLDLDSPSDTEDEDDIFRDAAFNPQSVLDSSPHKLGSLRDKLSRGTKIVADATSNPKRAVRNRYARRAAANLSKQPDNYIGVHDEELLNAHDELFDKVNSSVRGNRGKPAIDVDVDEVENARLKIDKIEGQRESRRNAWILSRHVVRAKVIRPETVKPSRQHYVTSDRQNTNWGRYLGHLALWYSRGFTTRHIDDFSHPPFDLRELALTIERLAVISTPWQSFLVDIRTIYRWHDSRRTVQIMSIYWLLWYFEHILSFALISGIYMVVRNKLYPSSVETIRQRVRRTQDLEEKARAWNELIQRHGNQDWIEPLLDDLGPLIQMHLGDLANLLEILQNFYRWERPGKTAQTLVFFTTLFLLVTFTSARYCLKIFWFAVGAIFFFSFPVSTNYPKYRHIVSPLYWVFYDIPNAAELAIIQLQEKSLLRHASRLRRSTSQELQQSKRATDVSASEGDESKKSSGGTSDSTHTVEEYILESYTFRALMYTQIRAPQDLLHNPLRQHNHCRLTVTHQGIWLYNAHDKNMFHRYTDLLEIRKLDLSAAANDDEDNKGPRHQQQEIEDPTNESKPEKKRWKFNDFCNGSSADSNSDSTHSDSDSDSASDSRSPAEHGIKAKTTKWAQKIYKRSALQHSPQALEFHFKCSSPKSPQSPPTQPLTNQVPYNHQSDSLRVLVSESDRDKIFSLILAWSQLKWMPLSSMRGQNKLYLRGTKGGGNKDLDRAIKRALR